MAWNEQEYLAANPDVAKAVSSGILKSGAEHYARHGASENRLLTTQQANDYASVNPDVAAAVSAGIFSSASEHYSQYGQNEGRKMAPDPEPEIPQVSAPAPTTVTANQTSQGQLQQMLSSDSPLMKQAAIMGQQQAAQRGLLNSSMAGQAAQGAMIANAAPLAQQDASTYYANNQANADRQQQAYMADQQYGYNSALSSQEADQALNNLYATSTANAWGVMANNLTDLVGQSANAIQQIQTNANITADNKATMIQQILDMRNTDIQFQQDLYNNLGTYLANTGVFPNMS